MANELEWNPKDRTEVTNRILSLSDDQLWTFLQKLEIGDVTSFNDVITEIRENEEDSSNLDIVFDEVKSKQSVLDLIAQITKPQKP